LPLFFSRYIASDAHAGRDVCVATTVGVTLGAEAHALYSAVTMKSAEALRTTWRARPADLVMTRSQGDCG
jgi:hypothetical protein